MCICVCQVHRRLLRDDYRGVGEALSEPGDYNDGLAVRGRLLLALTPPSTAADAHRPLGQEMVFQPTLSFQQEAALSTTPQVHFTTFTHFTTSGPEFLTHTEPLALTHLLYSHYT